MQAALIVFGILAALFGGLLGLFIFGEIPALVILVVVLALTVVGAASKRPEVTRWLLGTVVVVFVASVAIVGWGTWQLVQALTETDGPVAQADPAALASAQAKIDAAETSAAFRLELTESEMTAYVLDALADNEDNPLESVTLDVVDRVGDQQGVLEFTAKFKGGGVDGKGAITGRLRAGEIRIRLLDLSVGMFQVPGLAEGAIEDLIEEVGDLNKTLAEAGADVQSITIGGDRIIVTGTQVSTDLLTADALLSGLRDNAAAISAAVTPPPERLGPGRINAPLGSTSGEAPFMVALGDSLAANVGVVESRDGYVSRLHNQLEIRDGASYGLHNFGISGETTGTLIRAGQLDEAVAFMRDTRVAYVTIDIGANNLLGHLGSADCAESLQTPACAERIRNAMDTYDDDLIVIFDALQDAAPDATIIFMEAYNPFSLGFSGAIGLEAESNRILQEFNAIAAGVAAERGILVADAFTPMQNTTAATTHMLDPEPDIHPTPAGFDILACSFLEALGSTCPVS